MASIALIVLLNGAYLQFLSGGRCANTLLVRHRLHSFQTLLKVAQEELIFCKFQSVCYRLIIIIKCFN